MICKFKRMSCSALSALDILTESILIVSHEKLNTMADEKKFNFSFSQVSIQLICRYISVTISIIIPINKSIHLHILQRMKKKENKNK